MGDLPLRTPTHRRLGGPLPRQQANAPHAHPQPDRSPLIPKGCPSGILRGIRRNFFRLSPCCGQVAYVLLTRAPVAGGSASTPPLPLDLHVLSLSLAFILSQDQTLRCCLYIFFFFFVRRSRKLQTIVFCLLLSQGLPDRHEGRPRHCHPGLPVLMNRWSIIGN